MELVDGSIGIGQVHWFKLDLTEIIKTVVVSHFSIEAASTQQSVAVSLAYCIDSVVVRHDGAASCALADGHDRTPGNSNEQRGGTAQKIGFVCNVPILSRLRRHWRLTKRRQRAQHFKYSLGQPSTTGQTLCREKIKRADCVALWPITVGQAPAERCATEAESCRVSLRQPVGSDLDQDYILNVDN